LSIRALVAKILLDKVVRLGEEKRKKKVEERKKPQDENIMACPILFHGAAIKNQNGC